MSTVNYKATLQTPQLCQSAKVTHVSVGCVHLLLLPLGHLPHLPSVVLLLQVQLLSKHIVHSPQLLHSLPVTMATGHERAARRNTHTIKSKGKFLYSAVSSPQDRSKRFTLYFPDRPVHPDTISASLGSIQPYATINARRLLIHISTTVYSQVLIYTAE